MAIHKPLPDRMISKSTISTSHFSACVLCSPTAALLTSQNDLGGYAHSEHRQGGDQKRPAQGGIGTGDLYGYDSYQRGNPDQSARHQKTGERLVRQDLSFLHVRHSNMLMSESSPSRLYATKSVCCLPKRQQDSAHDHRQRHRGQCGQPQDHRPPQRRYPALLRKSRWGQTAPPAPVLVQDPSETGLMGPALEATLVGSGRPLLLAPVSEPSSVGTTVAIAWDSGLAATCAVASSMPLLSDADRVIILSADSPAANRAASPSRLAESLAWHGITAICHAVMSDGQPLSKALMRSAEEQGSDLLVIGAYGHSRIREMVLGGVTREVLAEPVSLPVLRAH
jgi:nucleotide-binding universal stress UspA family protein